MQSLRLWTSVYLSNNSTFAGPEDPTIQAVQGQTGTPTESSNEGTPGLQKTRSCENLLLMSDLNTSLSRRKSDPNIAMDHCEQQAQKLLKDAIGGDNSCSSESVKSSENDRSLSENGDITMNGTDSPHRLEDREVVENGIDAATTAAAMNGEVSVTDVEVSVTDGEVSVTNGEGSEPNGEGSVTNGEAIVLNGDNCDTNEHDKQTQHNELDTQVDNNGMEQIASNGDGGEEVGEVDMAEHGDMNGDMNGELNGELNGATDENPETEANAETTEETKLPNGIPSNFNGDLTNGNGTHEMNGHVDANPDKRGQSPDSSNESSENSIETISEGEENDSLVNGANSHENGELEPRKHSYTSVSNGFNNGDNKDIDSRIVSMKLMQRSVNGARYAASLESSSDTVIEDLQNGESNHTLIPSSSRNTNEVASLQSLCDRVTTNALNSIENTISISTSTSDLTDSRIHERFLANGLPGEGLLNVGESLHASLKLRCILSQTGLCKGPNGVNRGMNVDTSVGSSLQPTPVSPQSRNSTCPPTPGTSDGRVSVLLTE